MLPSCIVRLGQPMSEDAELKVSASHSLVRQSSSYLAADYGRYGLQSLVYNPLSFALLTLRCSLGCLLKTGYMSC